MAGRKRDKDHIRGHAGVELVELTTPPPSSEVDPLRWWTLHPNDATEVDLNEFAEGRAENPHGKRGLGKTWAGPFTGRPTLIHELAPWVKEQTLLNCRVNAVNIGNALRRWWRLFDALEATPLPGSKRLARVETVADLTAFHEAGAHQHGVARRSFSQFRNLANKARHALGLSQLHWIAPDGPQPDRQLISDDMAKVLRVALKTNWRAVRKDWMFRDQIRAEADRRDQGEPAVDLGEEGERLLANWREFRRVAEAIGTILPSSEDLFCGRSRQQMYQASLSLVDMRAIRFPKLWETDAAYHMALLDSAWNPSTMLNIDATDPYCVAPSLKDSQVHLVLQATPVGDGDTQGDDEGGTLSVGASKPRARGKLQIAHGLAKNTCSAPFIVRAFIARTEPLRAVLREQLRHAVADHARLALSAADRTSLGEAIKRVQLLREGVRSVWVYVTRAGTVQWISKRDTGIRYWADGKRNPVTYLGMVIDQLARTGKTVGKVTPSDLRDLAARRYFQQTGSIVALMLKLGHSRLRTTTEYLDNQLFRAENDEVARRFLDHLFDELAQGRADLTILAQLSRHGPLSPEMEARLIEYRSLMRSRLGVGCSNPRRPPRLVDPEHVPGQLCCRHSCLLGCGNAKFLPESLDGIAMRAEELMAISDVVPREAWLRQRFHEELEGAEGLLEHYYPSTEVAEARAKWHARIESGHHRIPGLPLALVSAEETHERQES